MSILHILSVYSCKELIQISILKLGKHKIQGHSTLLIFNFFFLAFSPPGPRIIIITTNKVFTGFQSTHHFQEDNDIIGKKRSNFMSTVFSFCLGKWRFIEMGKMESQKIVKLNLKYLNNRKLFWSWYIIIIITVTKIFWAKFMRGTVRGVPSHDSRLLTMTNNESL